MTRTLIAAAKLGSAISSFRKSHDSLMEEAHVIAVSVLSYTAKSGRTDLLNDFYSGLSAPLAGAFKQYVGRILGTDREQHWLGFEKSVFTLTVDRQAQRDAFQKEVPAYLEGKTDTKYAPFTTRIALDRAADVFANSDFLKALDNLMKRAQKEGSHVSPELIETAGKFRKEIEDDILKIEKRATAKAGSNAIIAKSAKAKAPQPMTVQ